MYLIWRENLSDNLEMELINTWEKEVQGTNRRSTRPYEMEEIVNLREIEVDENDYIGNKVEEKLEDYLVDDYMD